MSLATQEVKMPKADRKKDMSRGDGDRVLSHPSFERMLGDGRRRWQRSDEGDGSFVAQTRRGDNDYALPLTAIFR